jgi:hypothetical protein
MVRRTAAFVALIAAACATPDQGPTASDFDMARTAWAHGDADDGGIAHRRRFEALRCAPSGDAETYSCTYREWAESRPWPTKRAVLQRQGDAWRFITGDAPLCTTVYLE